MTHGAYKFTGTVLFDCEEDVLVYTNGTVYNLPVTDGDDTAPETPAIMENQLGFMFCDISDVEDGELVLIWQDPITNEIVYFMRSDENAPDILVPEIVDLDIEDGVMPDGIYWVNIVPDALRSGALGEVTFCTVDIFSGLDIRQVSPGEMLFRNYTMYWIDSVSEDGTVQYRDAATSETGIMSFMNIPGSDNYVAMDESDSDSPMLTFSGITEMPLDDAAKMILVTGDSMDETAVDATGMADIMDSESCKTFVVIRNGRITEIRRYRDVSVAGMLADVFSASSDQ